MRKIEALTVDDPDRDRILEAADAVVVEVNGMIEATDSQQIMIDEPSITSLLLALVTWKKIAEERQEHIDFMNDLKMEAGTFDGLDAPSGEGT